MSLKNEPTIHFLRGKLLVLGEVSHMAVWNVYSKIEIQWSSHTELDSEMLAKTLQ